MPTRPSSTEVLKTAGGCSLARRPGRSRMTRAADSLSRPGRRPSAARVVSPGRTASSPEYLSREVGTSLPLMLLVLLVPAYGAILLVAADRGPNHLLWTVAAGVSLTQTAVLLLVATPVATLAVTPAFLWGIAPPALGALTIRLGAVRQASVGTRWAAAGTAWFVALSPVYARL